MESLILYGGSFDPIHNGHLRIAGAASLMLNSDVVFIPTKANRGKTPEASQQERLDMLRLALRYDGSPNFSLSLYEVKSKEIVNYTIDTVRYFKKRYPSRKLYLLIGADQVNAFPKWKEPEEIVKLVTILYVPRNGITLDDSVLLRFNMKRLNYDKAGEVSSSDVRSLRSIDIPIPVRNFIERKGLYYMKTLKGMISPHRLAHSVSVANLAYGIARSNDVASFQNAYIAGLLHDCGKNLSKEEAVERMKKNHPEEYKTMPLWTYHQYLGADLAKEIFGVSDPAVLDAIACHASGKAHATPLAKIIYAADKIEPTRGYDSSALISACFRSYYLGFVKTLEENRLYLKQKGFKIDNPLTAECMRLYLGVK